MAQPSYIFGGQTGLTYDQIQKQRDIANELLRANMSTPQNVGEGLSAIGRALAAKAIEKRTTRADEANRAAYGAQRDQIFGTLNSSFGGATTPASYSPAPTEAQSVANDTMSVLGNFGALEDQYKLPKGYLDRTYAIESGGNPNAKNPNSSAEGPFQFIDSTAAQYGLTDKTDLGASAAAAARLAADNKAMLTQALGREPTAGELYLAHQQGGAGAVKLLTNPNARAVDIVGPDAVTLNGGDPNMTASEFAGKWVQKFGGGTPAPQGQPPINPAILMQLAEIQGNPYASESDKAIASLLMDQTVQAMDPMRKLELERAQLEVQAMKNPQPGFKNMTDEEEKAAGLDTSGVYQQGADGKIAVIQEPAKPANNPSSVGEYNFYAEQAKARGETPMPYEKFITLEATAGNPAAGNFTQPVTPGQEQIDKAYAPEYVQWTQGGGADMANQISTIEGIADRLESGKENLTGPLVGSQPDWLGASTTPNAVSAREDVESVVQRNLRVLLGAQFTQAEGDRLIARAYNPRLPEEENAVRLRRLAKGMRAAADARADQAAYYEANGTLVGWKGKVWTPSDFENIITEDEKKAAPSAPDADGWQIINGVKVRVKQ